MKQVNLIRDRILRGQASEIARLRIFVSTTEEDGTLADLLRGEGETDLLAEITDLILARLGHDSGEPGEERFSKSRRRANRARAAV